MSADDFSEEASHMNEVVISLMYSSLLICVSKEVVYLLYFKYQCCLRADTISQKSRRL